MIVGIDVSTKDVAIVVINNGKLLKSAKLETKLKFPHNILKIKDQLDDFLDKMRYLVHDFNETGDPTFYIEKARYQAPIIYNQINLGYYEMIGMIVAEISEWFGYLNIVCVSPSIWKKGIDYPNNKKMTLKQKGELSIKVASELVGEQILDNDIADAINIAIGSYRKGELING